MIRQGAIFPAAEELPKGPHRLTREQVGASQRARLLGAVAEVVASTGYGACTVAAVCRRAGVSPNTFYEHFDDKLECFLAAYQRFADALLERMGAAIDPDSGWEQFITSTLAAYLGTLEDDPSVARAFVIEGEAAGPHARELRREALARFADLIRFRHEQIRAADPALGPLPDEVYLAFVHGVRALVCEQIEAADNPQLRALAPAIIIWLQATMLGAAEAQRGG